MPLVKKRVVLRDYLGTYWILGVLNNEHTIKSPITCTHQGRDLTAKLRSVEPRMVVFQEVCPSAPVLRVPDPLGPDSVAG